MRWQGRRGSSNVEDRRGGGAVKGGLGFGATLLIAGLVWALGGDPMAVLSQGLQSQASRPAGGNAASAENQDPQLTPFVSIILADTETTWREVFAAEGKTYRDPKLVLFTDQVASACGT